MSLSAAANEQQYRPSRRGKGHGDKVLILPSLTQATVSSSIKGDDINDEDDDTGEHSLFQQQQRPRKQANELMLSTELTSGMILSPMADESICRLIIQGDSNPEDGFDYSIGSIPPTLHRGPFAFVPTELLLQERPDEKMM